jgi:hypothetical protein
MKALFMNGIEKDLPLKLKNHFDRRNRDSGEFRLAKKELQDKIAEKETKEQIKVIEQGEHLDFDIPEQDKIIEQIFGRI